VAELRRRAPATRIVLISNMPPDRLEAEASRLGTDDWVMKARKPEDLRDAVRRAVA
jgi:DNA-binding NarL/FixJ family response regulator